MRSDIRQNGSGSLYCEVGQPFVQPIIPFTMTEGHDHVR
jgi:hypothetical protein